MQKINKKYKFDNYIVSNDNKNTVRVLKEMATSSNLIYLAGDVGTGKTHLVQAVANKLKDKNIIYVTAEGFMNDFVNAFKTNNIGDFREEYRQCDILIIDDFHFFNGKEATQEEFFHTIKELFNNNKIVIVTSDKQVAELTGIEARIKDYLSGALKLELSYLDEISKVELIKSRLKIFELTLDEEDIKLLSDNHKTVRAIYGDIYKLEIL